MSFSNNHQNQNVFPTKSHSNHSCTPSLSGSFKVPVWLESHSWMIYCIRVVLNSLLDCKILLVLRYYVKNLQDFGNATTPSQIVTSTERENLAIYRENSSSKKKRRSKKTEAIGRTRTASSSIIQLHFFQLL